MVREADPADRGRTAGPDPQDPTGRALAVDLLTWSLASTLRARAGLSLEDEANAS